MKTASGRFSIAGQEYTLLLRKKRLRGAADPGLAETLAALEIRDVAGNLAYQKAFPYEAEEARFRRSISASAQLLSGKAGTGLLVRYTEVPAAGQASESWQVFGMVNGKLALFDKPSTTGGEMAGPGPFAGIIARGRNGVVRVVMQPDIVEFRAWTGSFYVIVPVRVDWVQGKLLPGQRCYELNAGQMRERGCEMQVQAERRPGNAELTFVRLFPETGENVWMVKHVVLKRNSKVEFLEAQAIVTWKESTDLIQTASSDVWLKVRIDDKEGWIHGDEDFAAVGLRPGSSGR